VDQIFAAFRALSAGLNNENSGYIYIRVTAAGDKLPKRPAFNEQGLTALGHISPVGSSEVYLFRSNVSLFKVFVKGTIKILDDLLPFTLGIGDIIEFSFHVRGELFINDIRENAALTNRW